LGKSFQENSAVAFFVYLVGSAKVTPDLHHTTGHHSSPREHGLIVDAQRLCIRFQNIGKRLSARRQYSARVRAGSLCGSVGYGFDGAIALKSGPSLIL
jgi:hypothetical protein